MRHKTSHTKTSASKAERARQLLSGGGVIREDSDDELGFDDFPWEWIYANDYDSEHEEQDIVGARMGTFECKIGDCVLLKAEGTHEAWIGLICDFEEAEAEGKMANFMWFSTEREIRNKQKKRVDAAPVGLTIESGEDFKLNYHDRTRSTSHLLGTSTLYPRSMGRLLSCLRPRLILGILLAGFHDLLRRMGKSSFAGEAATLALRPTLRSSTGRQYIGELRTFLL